MATAPSSSPQGIQTASFKGILGALNLPALPSHPAADPARHPLDAFLLAAAEQVAAALDIDFDKAWQGTQLHNKADIIVTVPRFRLPGKPADVAQKVVDAFKPNAYLASASNEKGFVWITCHTPTLTALTLGTIHELSRGRSSGSWAGEDLAESSGLYGTNATGAGKQMVVEFSSPNIAKPFHAGHLRSTIIGAFIANLYEANGWKVERWNYLGDWGKQFGLLAVGWEKYGDEALLKEDAVKHLYDVYVRINKTAEAEPEIHDAARAYFKAMEDDDEHALGLWKKFRDLSIEKYKETYARLNVHFDVYSGESQVSKENIATALEHIRASDYVEKADNGALLIDLSKYKLEKAVIERKDGTPLYITRDIGEAKQRWDRFVAQRGDGMGFDKMIYVVASQQDLHLAQFFKVLELIGYEWAQPAAQRLLHINFGMVLGMSTRKGTAVFLEHILDEAKENMHNVMRGNEDKYVQVENPELTADVLGMTAVKVQDMGAKRINNYQFDWSRMLSFEGDTGPYMQYNHVRLCSVERRVADLDGVALPSVLDPSSLRLDLLAEPKAREVIMLLAAWPETVRSNLRDLQPSTIVHFCFRLCHALSSAWEILIVRKQDKDVALARLFLFRCSKDVLSAAMRLLTIQPLQRM